MQPARRRNTDAGFNVGTALAAVQVWAPGASVAMNDRVFPADHGRKNAAKHGFEDLGQFRGFG